MLFYLQGNQLGPSGWQVVMDALERCAGLTSLNGYDEYQDILDGGLLEFQDQGHECALAVGRFLPRSASTLTCLELK